PRRSPVGWSSNRCPRWTVAGGQEAGPARQKSYGSSHVVFLAALMLSNALWRMRLQGITTTGKARVRHEILLRIERFFAVLRHDTPRGSIRQYFKTLPVVHNVPKHDLTKDLLMNGHVRNRNKGFDAAVQVSRHQVGRADIDD